MSIPVASTTDVSRFDAALRVDDPLFPRLATNPEQDAVVVPMPDRGDRFRYRRISFPSLQSDIMQLASGLQGAGVRQGMRIAILVPFGPDFIALVFAIFKTGAQVVLMDPGIGVRNLVRCLAEVDLDGFIGIPAAQLVRWWNRRKFPRCRIHVVVGNGWPGLNLRELRRASVDQFDPVELPPENPAAIIFTSGSTGPAKGVQYTRANFIAQVRQIQDRYCVTPGSVDLACFPLFGLFNAAMGVTTVIPNMNTSRPATANPARLVRVIRDLNIDQSFASPIVWDRIGRYCAIAGTKVPSLRRVFSAGAPVAPRVLRQLQDTLSCEARIATPYGATEALPVATIDAVEVTAETASQTATGAGICVGQRFADIQWRVIAITDEALETMDQVSIVPQGEIGELIVSGPQITEQYVTRIESIKIYKIRDGDKVWHRMGDVGYFDAKERFWFCGRKAHRVQTSRGTMFTICCEAIFNEHPRIYRSALVGVGPVGQQIPVMICEPWPEEWPRKSRQRTALRAELAELAKQNSMTATFGVEQILLKRRLPVDARHNAKIVREQLAPWAARKMAKK